MFKCTAAVCLTDCLPKKNAADDNVGGMGRFLLRKNEMEGKRSWRKLERKVTKSLGDREKEGRCLNGRIKVK